MDFLRHITWRPGIGDPNIMGWLTVVAYAIAAILCALAGRAATRSRSAVGGSQRGRLWFGVAALMVCLCINKQLDLQSLLTDIGRAFAKEHGWYGERRGVQKVFIICLLAASLLAVAWTIWHFEKFWRTHPVLFSGLAFLLTFIIVRAVSMHHVDAFLRVSLGGVRMNWILELTGIGLVAAAGLREIAYQNAERV
jgi:hypothetical protein